MTFAIQLPKRNKTKRISNLLLKRAAKSIGTVAVRRLRLLYIWRSLVVTVFARGGGDKNVQIYNNMCCVSALSYDLKYFVSALPIGLSEALQLYC